jgi:hypothetical protein
VRKEGSSRRVYRVTLSAENAFERNILREQAEELSRYQVLNFQLRHTNEVFELTVDLPKKRA